MPAYMTQKGGGPANLAGNEQVIDPTFNAARIAMRPLDYANSGRVLGHYRVAMATGTTVSIGAGGILAYQRWTDTSSYYVLMRLQVGAYLAATITAAAAVDVAAVISRGSTAVGSGGNAITLSGNNQKMRSAMGTSQIIDCRVATTSALTRPTGGTADANPFAISPLIASFNIQNPGTATFNNQSTNTIFDLFKWDALGQHPPVLVTGETIELQEFTAGPVTGGIRFYSVWEWAEVVVF